MSRIATAGAVLALMIGMSGLTPDSQATEPATPAPNGGKAATEKEAAPDIPMMFRRSGLTVSAPAWEGTAAAEPPKFPPPEDLKKKADAGDAVAMREIGEFYHDGKNSDWTAAHGWFMKAAEKGDLDAWYYAGRDFWGAHGVPRDAKLALEWLGKAADAGQAGAQSLLGQILQSGFRAHVEVMEVEPDLTRAIPLLEKAAGKGDALAQYALGRAYMAGEGVAADGAAGLALLTKSADQGYVSAQRDLGEMYYMEDPALKRDLKLSTYYFTKAAEQGDLRAQYFLARFYHEGIGVAKDLAKAAEWYRRVDQHEDMLDEDYELIVEYVMGAQSQLGILYRDGTGVEENLAEAARWYRRAAMLGSPGSQFRLGDAYEKGAGVTADPVEAYRWYTLAASNLASPFGAEMFDDVGAKEAGEAIARLDNTLPPETLAKAKAAGDDEMRLLMQMGSAYSWGVRPRQSEGYWNVGPP